jgi:hypothetical protein
MRDVFPMVIGKSKQTLPYLPLGMVMAYLRSEQCLDGLYRLQRLRPGGCPEFPLSPLLDQVESSEAPVCLFSSYVWNHNTNLSVAAKIKAQNAEATILFGGPHVPRHADEAESFLEQHDFIDIAVLGEGELACAEILSALAAPNPGGALASVPGIAYRDGATAVRTASRERVRDLETLPSPYLSDEFEPWLNNFPLTVLETNRGCPFGCTYCDWGSATLQKVSKFSVERVTAEIDYLCERSSETIFIADANFGMLEQDIAIAEAVVAARERTGYPRRLFTNFAKNGGRRLLSVIRILHKGGLLPTGIIALQTTDEDVLKAIDRNNIRTSAYETLMGHFHRENIPMASDLMIGLPGQTTASFAGDLQFCFDWKVSAHGNYTSLMPNAPMARKDYREKWQIGIDSRNLIISTSTFSESDMVRMQNLYTTYHFFVRLGCFRHGLYCLQADYGLPAIEALSHWLDVASSPGTEWPLSRRVWNEILAPGSAHADWAMLRWSDNAHFLFDDPVLFYMELLSLLQQKFEFSLPDSVAETLVLAQAAVMPNRHRSYPLRVSLAHDLSDYMADVRAAPSLTELQNTLTPLAGRPPAPLRAQAPHGIPDPLVFQTLGGHADEWELPSRLAFHYTEEFHENTA